MLCAFSVPGMPDGDKGANYVAYDHYLYKAYNATARLGIVKCPSATTPLPTTSKPTKELGNAVKLSTSANAPSQPTTELTNTVKVSTSANVPSAQGTSLASSIPATSLTTKPNSSTQNAVSVTKGAPTESSKIPQIQTTQSGGPNAVPTV